MCVCVRVCVCRQLNSAVGLALVLLGSLFLVLRGVMAADIEILTTL